MGRQKLADLSLDPFVLAMDQADDLKPIPEKFASAWLSVSVTVMEEWRSAGRPVPPPPPQPFKLTGKTVLYAMGDLRAFVRATLEAARATARPPAPPERTVSTSAAEALAKITGVDLAALGLDQEVLRGGRRKKIRQDSFPQFMALAEPDDEWVFAMIPDSHHGAYRRPVDLIETLNMPLEQIEDGTCEQLTMMDYLDRLTVYLNAKAGQDRAAERAAGSLREGEGLPGKGNIKRS